MDGVRDATAEAEKMSLLHDIDSFLRTIKQNLFILKKRNSIYIC